MIYIFYLPRKKPMLVLGKIIDHMDVAIESESKEQAELKYKEWLLERKTLSEMYIFPDEIRSPA